jgi:hypothetical protein
VVFDGYLHVESFAGEKTAIAKMAGVNQAAQRTTAPYPGDEEDDDHKSDHGQKFLDFAHNRDQENQDSETQPAVIQQRAGRVTPLTQRLCRSFDFFRTLKIEQAHSDFLPQRSTGTGTVLTRSLTTSSARRPLSRVCGLI